MTNEFRSIYKRQTIVTFTSQLQYTALVSATQPTVWTDEILINLTECATKHALIHFIAPINSISEKYLLAK